MGLDRAGIGHRVLVFGASSMAEALEAGRRAARADVVVYLHEDTELLNRHARDELIAVMRRHELGSVAGAAGSVGRHTLPWPFAGRTLGMVHGSSATAPVSRDTPAGLLDGVALAQSGGGGWRWHSMPGWHGYDAQRCLEAHERELEVFVTPVLEAAHYPPSKGAEYHNEHRWACRELAATWGLRCAL